jgi:hypothetical protein
VRPVPRFHLNLFDGVNAMDEEGRNYPSLEAARTEAITGARDVIANLIKSGQPVCRSYRIEITDETGSIQHTVRFGEVMDLRP